VLQLNKEWSELCDVYIMHTYISSTHFMVKGTARYNDCEAGRPRINDEVSRFSLLARLTCVLRILYCPLLASSLLIIQNKVERPRLLDTDLKSWYLLTHRLCNIHMMYSVPRSLPLFCPCRRDFSRHLHIKVLEVTTQYQQIHQLSHTPP
jgi:hypothetical protein